MIDTTVRDETVSLVPDLLIGWMVVGGLVGGLFEIQNQISQNGWHGFSGLNVNKIIFAAGTGALGGIGTTWIKSIVIGAVTNAANTAYQQLGNNSCDKK